MVLTRWRPWVPAFDDLDAMMDRMMRRTFGMIRGEEYLTPALDVKRQDGEVVVRVEIPGIDPEKDLEVRVEDGMLTIEGRKHREREEQKGQWYISETATGAFQRRLTLPESVDADQIDASYEAGVLTLTIPVPKDEQAQPRRIEVKRGKREQIQVGRSDG